MDGKNAVVWLSALMLGAVTGGCHLESRFYDGERREFATPAGVEDVRIPVRGDQSAHAWFVPAPNSGPAVERRPALLFCHGSRTQIDALLPELRQIADRAGVGLMLISYRGYGKSDSVDHITRDTTVADALAAYDTLRARSDVDPMRIVVMGYSLGGVPALAVAAERPVAGVIVGGTYARAEEALADRGMGRWAWLIGSDHDPADSVSRMHGRPIYIFHGGGDGDAPVYHAYELAAAASRAGSPVTVDIIAGAGHRSILSDDPELVVRLAAFIHRTTGRTAADGDADSRAE